MDKENIIERGAGNLEKPGWICLPDPTVSRLHAKIYIKENQLFLENLSTRNGTFWNDKKIDSPVPLTHGDKITIGKSDLFFYENFIAGETQELYIAPPQNKEKTFRLSGMYIHFAYAGIVLFMAVLWTALYRPAISVTPLEKENTVVTKEKPLPNPQAEGKETVVQKNTQEPPVINISENKVPMVNPVSPNIAEKKNDTPVSAPKEAPNVPVQAEGYVYSSKPIPVLMPWEAKIEKILVEKGTWVEEGQSLISLDTQRLKEEIGLYRLELEVNQKECMIGKEQKENAEKNLKEIHSLYTKGLESRQRYEKIQEDLATMKNRLLSLEQKQKLSQAYLDKAQEKLQQTKIKSPARGIVLEKICKEGDLLQPNTLLFQIAQTQDMVAKVEIPSYQASNLYNTQRVLLSLSDKKYKGLVQNIVDNKTSALVEISFLNADTNVIPGNKVSAKFLLKK